MLPRTQSSEKRQKGADREEEKVKRTHVATTSALRMRRVIQRAGCWRDPANAEMRAVQNFQAIQSMNSCSSQAEQYGSGHQSLAAWFIRRAKGEPTGCFDRLTRGTQTQIPTGASAGIGESTSESVSQAQAVVDLK